MQSNDRVIAIQSISHVRLTRAVSHTSLSHNYIRIELWTYVAKAFLKLIHYNIQRTTYSTI